jgi:hypothetical protein
MDVVPSNEFDSGARSVSSRRAVWLYGNAEGRSDTAAEPLIVREMDEEHANGLGKSCRRQRPCIYLLRSDLVGRNTANARDHRNTPAK